MTIPLIGTGIGSISIKDGVESLFKAVMKIIENDNFKNLKLINLIEINEDIAKKIEEEFEMLFRKPI